MSLRRLVPLLPLLLACGSGSGPADASTTDGSVDSSPADAGAPTRYAMGPCGEADFAGVPLSTRCGHFVDAQGRVRLLFGVNARVAGLFDVSFDDGREPLEPIPDFDADDARRMHELGFDTLRLPLNWSGLEPTDTSPPTYDTDYLDEVARVVDLCRAQHVAVLLDLHQDAYSKEVGEDGAPYWAISPEPATRLGGPLTDLDARRQSADVLAAFATFFGDAEPGPSLRARFASVAAALATRFAGDDAVLGIEIFNEPVADDAQNQRLNEQVARAIRAADPTRLVVFEPPVLPRNFTDQSARPDAPFPVPGAVYAPHVYTLSFFGSEAQREGMTLEGLRKANRTARAEAQAFGVPLLVGEFGYDPAATRAADWYRFERALMDEYLASSTFWVWKERSQGRWGVFDYDDGAGTWTERPEVVAWVSRPRLAAASGWLTSYEVTDTTLRASFDGTSELTAPNLVHLPTGTTATARCDGEPVASSGVEEDLLAFPCGGEGRHELELSLSEGG